MKLVVPSEVQVGAHTFLIVWAPRLMRLMECRGESEYQWEHKIRLTPGRPITQTFQTLLHEGIHQVDHVFSAGDITEEQVNTLAGGLCQLLMSLGIEPDFSQIPEEEL